MPLSACQSLRVTLLRVTLCVSLSVLAFWWVSVPCRCLSLPANATACVSDLVVQKSGDLGVVRVLEGIGDPDQVQRAVHPHPALRVARVHLRHTAAAFSAMLIHARGITAQAGELSHGWCHSIV